MKVSSGIGVRVRLDADLLPHLLDDGDVGVELGRVVPDVELDARIPAGLGQQGLGLVEVLRVVGLETVGVRPRGDPVVDDVGNLEHAAQHVVHERVAVQGPDERLSARACP